LGGECKYASLASHLEGWLSIALLVRILIAPFVAKQIILERKMILQEETEDEEMMQNPSFTRKVKELRPGFRRNPLNLCFLL